MADISFVTGAFMPVVRSYLLKARVLQEKLREACITTSLLKIAHRYFPFTREYLNLQHENKSLQDNQD